MSSFTLSITGMSCGHCLNAVNKALAKVQNLETVSVQIGRAEIRTEDPTLVEAAKTAIEDAGYHVESISGL
jgi:copper chaperone